MEKLMERWKVTLQELDLEHGQNAPGLATTGRQMWSESYKASLSSPFPFSKLLCVQDHICFTMGLFHVHV